MLLQEMSGAIIAKAIGRADFFCLLEWSQLIIPGEELSIR